MSDTDTLSDNMKQFYEYILSGGFLSKVRKEDLQMMIGDPDETFDGITAEERVYLLRKIRDEQKRIYSVFPSERQTILLNQIAVLTQQAQIKTIQKDIMGTNEDLIRENVRRQRDIQLRLEQEAAKARNKFRRENPLLSPKSRVFQAPPQISRSGFEPGRRIIDKSEDSSPSRSVSERPSSKYIQVIPIPEVKIPDSTVDEFSLVSQARNEGLSETAIIALQSLKSTSTSIDQIKTKSQARQMYEDAKQQHLSPAALQLLASKL